MNTRLAVNAFLSVVLGVLGMLVGGVVALVVSAAMSSKPPVQIMGEWAETMFSQHGGVLEMRMKFLRMETCNSTSSIWMWRWVGAEGSKERMRYFVPVSTGLVTLDDSSPVIQEFVMAHPLPRAVTPGPWFIRIKYLDYCRPLAAIFGPTIRVSEDIPVAVTAPGSD